ncbi:unnamed protein product [Victoria cruziana]
MAPNAISTVELLVHMDCDGCEKKIRKTISKMNGVDSLDIDFGQQKVTVTGYVDRRKVLKAVRRTGRKAEFWPYPYDGEYHPFMPHHFQDSTFAPTYNYYRHGYNSIDDGYFSHPAHVASGAVDDNAAALFSDENVHSCSIM